MRRLQATLVIVALLAGPLALVSRGFATDAGECNRYCCLPHGTHSYHGQNSPSKVSGAMQCHHGDAGSLVKCFMRSGHHNLDFGLLAPMTPTSPSLLQRLAAPQASRYPFTGREFALPAGHFAAPFEPPRS